MSVLPSRGQTSLRLLVGVAATTLLIGVVPGDPVSAAAGGGRLSGLIQDTTGKSFAAADIVLTARDSGAVVTSGRSDATGRYDVSVPDGHYDVAVVAPTTNGERRAKIGDVDVHGETKLNVAIVGDPKPSVTFRGSVRDGAGRAVPFATVSAGGTTVTDADGRFDFETPGGQQTLRIIRPLPEGSRITVEAPGFTLSGDRDVDVAIKTVGLTVHVRDTQGQPVPGVRVSSWSDESCESCTGAFEVAGLKTSRRSAVRRTTDSNGTVRLQALPAKSVRLMVEAPYRSGWTNVIRDGVTLTGDTEVDMTVGWDTASAGNRFAAAAASSETTLTGTARTSDGTPLAGAHISLSAGDQLVVHDDVTDDGSFSVSAPPGRYTLRFYGPEEGEDWDRGYEPEHDSYSITLPGLDLTADAQRDLVIPAAAVAIRVLDPAGAPVADAWVRAASSGDSTGFPVASGLTGSGSVSSYWHTGSDGIARIRMLPGAAAAVSIEPPGGRGLPTSTTLPAGTSAARDIRLDWGPTLRGHARTATGEPADLSIARLSGDGLSSRISSGPDGTYAVTAEPGRYGISIDPPDVFHTPSSSVSYSTLRSDQTIGLTADRTLDLVMPDGRGATISAVDVAGRPAGEWNEDFSGSSFEKVILAPGLEASTGFASYGPGSFGDTTDLPVLGPSAIKGDLMYLGNEDYEIDGARVFPGQRTVFAAAYGTALPTPDAPVASSEPGPTPGAMTVHWAPPKSEGDIKAYLIVPDHDFHAATWAPATATAGELHCLTPADAYWVTVYALNQYGLGQGVDFIGTAAAGTVRDPSACTETLVGGDTTGPTQTEDTSEPADPGTPDHTAGPPAAVWSATNAPATASGYWALSSNGQVYNFGDAAQHGDVAAGAVDLEPTPTGKGYWTLNKNGQVQASGDATTLGDVETGKLAKGELPASLSATQSGKGYWVFTNRGRVMAFGDAPFLGDVSAVKLNGAVLGSVPTPSGRGYYMVASDGGIFSFGDATFLGSMGGTKLNAPVQSVVPDADGKGYWLVASDGGIFAFEAPFKGSLGGVKLNKPVVGMVRYGDGYLMVGADGGIFNFSTLPFSGSLGDKPPAAPVVAVAALP